MTLVTGSCSWQGAWAHIGLKEGSICNATCVAVSGWLLAFHCTAHAGVMYARCRWRDSWLPVDQLGPAVQPGVLSGAPGCLRGGPP